MTDKPSLEALIEGGGLGLDIFHPGGRRMTEELAGLMGVGPGTTVLDVAAGTGETARLLADSYRAVVTAVDASAAMIRRMRDGLQELPFVVRCAQGDAHRLPFADGSFDVVLSECAVCQFDKARALREMIRVARPGGRVGLHDLCWKPGTPEPIRLRLAELEGERPETLDDWVRLFRTIGLTNVRALDRSEVMASWTKDVRQTLGVSGYLRAVLTAVRRWGVRGVLRVLESERIFGSRWLGYVLIVGTRAR